MTVLTICMAVIAAFFLVIGFSSLYKGSDGEGLFCLLIAFGCICLSVLGNSDWYKAKIAEDELQKKDARRASTKAYVIIEADGCKVYAFKQNGKEHYFTRCPESKTSTTTTQCHLSGKFIRCGNEAIN